MGAGAKGRKRIVILGGGFAGAYCAQELERRLGQEVEVWLIDQHNYFIFYPLLVEAGTGNLEPRHAVVSIRRFAPTARFRMATLAGMDAEAKRVRYRMVGRDEVETLAYDHLVVALGSISLQPPIPGLAEYGYQMKSLSDAVALRDRAIQLLELAEATEDEAKRQALLRLVVVGGSFTGVEVAGEFNAFLQEGTHVYPSIRREDIKVTLIERDGHILKALGEDLGDYAAWTLEKHGVEILYEDSVEEVRPGEVVLKSGRVVRTHTLIWCAGIAPHPVVAKLPVPVDPRGYIVCEPDLRVQGYQDVWGIGDCAVNVDPEGDAYPATAQHAVREGEHVAKNLAAVLRGGKATPLVYKSQGQLTSLGGRRGAAKIMGVKFSGVIAWFIWRTVYLSKMPGWARRLRLTLEWTMDLFFTRDLVQLGVHRVPGRREE